MKKAALAGIAAVVGAGGLGGWSAFAAPAAWVKSRAGSVRDPALIVRGNAVTFATDGSGNGPGLPARSDHRPSGAASGRP